MTVLGSDPEVAGRRVHRSHLLSVESSALASDSVDRPADGRAADGPGADDPAAVWPQHPTSGTAMAIDHPTDIDEPRHLPATQVDEAILALTVHAGRLDQRLTTIEAKLSHLIDEQMAVATLEDVIDARIGTAKLAGEVARINIELRAGLQRLADEQRASERRRDRSEMLAESIVDLSDRMYGDDVPADPETSLPGDQTVDQTVVLTGDAAGSDRTVELTCDAADSGQHAPQDQRAESDELTERSA